ncbi:hypothetical protein [Polynucleobacter sp. MWH-UH2A]|uniref:hypothetical protein n=1 Tax=Polynucleobacter sp. MWH-UH2A TaxID=1855617 RepID=UPI001BFEB5FD|nr:hypothetical protein [Polynucleobacter sp. MWH-UH2A]QWD63383.1 hypothetical protein IC571_06690 [Polynucleobacter sp. MWH-UH2A]
MAIDLNAAVQKLCAVRAKVREESPSTWAELEVLCANIPATIGKAQIWQMGKDKPCWSNIKVSAGERIVSDLQLSVDFQSSAAIASASWLMVRNPQLGRSSSAFALEGDSVRAYIAGLQPGGLKSYVWRLYAIRELAKGLENNANPKLTALIQELLTKQSFTGSEIERWTKNFAKQVGYGWGYITVNHMLTDLGVSIKPDVWVRRSAARLGFIEGIPSNSSFEQIDALSEKVDFQIINIALDAATLMEPLVAVQTEDPKLKKRLALREIDLCLMRWGKLGFLNDGLDL